jgi:hypothetical protein
MDIYPEDMHDLWYILDSIPETEDDFQRYYLSSKLWRLNNLYTIVDKYGVKIKFEMNYAQHKVYAASILHPRILILKSRQQGISTFWLVSFFDDAIFLDTINVGLMAQGADEASTLLERTKFMWDHFDPEVKSFLGIRLTKDNTKEFALSNGSTIFIRTSFRSATLQRLHISEMGKIANKFPDRAKETKTGTLQALARGNIGVVESTAEGRNMFKDMWDTASEQLARGMQLTDKDFYPVFLSWLDDPDCVEAVDQYCSPTHAKYFHTLESGLGVVISHEQRNFWLMQYRELGDDTYQEYPATPDEAFMQTKNGAYYARLFTNYVVRYKRIVKDLYDLNLDVHIGFDLGISDTFTMFFFQLHRGEYRIIHEYTNSGEGLAHYVNYIKELPYTIGECILPHDVNVRELSTGETRLHKLKLLGMRRVKVLPKAPVAEGIDAVRDLIPYLWIDESCEYAQDCLRNYTKEWDDVKGIWKTTPLHDKYSHGADTFRYIAMGTKRRREQREKARKISKQLVVDGLSL